MKYIHLRKTILATMLVVWASVADLSAQTPQLNTSTRNVRNVLDRIRTGATNLQREIDRARYDNAANNADDRVANQLSALTTSVNNMRANVSPWSRTTTDVSADLDNILDRANRINRILSRNATSPRVNTQWNSLRSDINTLARYYGMSTNWDTGGYNNNGGYGGGWNNGAWNDRVTGTYRLNVAQSDSVSDVIDRSLGSYSGGQSDFQRRALERRLASPEIIAIEKRGQRITLGSTNQAQVTFQADGQAHTEINPRGRTVTTRVTSTNRDLVIDYSGDRMNDFNVSFSADRNGRLRVTRRIYLENQNQTISVSSIYDRLSPTADWSQVRQSNDPYGNNNGNPNYNNTTGGFYVPNNVTLTATLRNMVSTRTSQVGDRFTLDVISPNSYRGAVIEGHISDKGNSGRVSGRANLQFDFDSISINGRTYQFAGMIQSVSSANGDSVSVNNEGTIRDSNQTTKTATRAGIGAVLGAIIGAVAGGGSGAAIGAGVGAGAGAGTVLIGGRDSIELGEGSTFTILSSAPANVSYNPRN